MSKLWHYAQQHPGLGIISSWLASLQSFMETSTPVLQYLGLVIGIGIGALTFWIKLREARKKLTDNK